MDVLDELGFYAPVSPRAIVAEASTLQLEAIGELLPELVPGLEARHRAG